MLIGGPVPRSESTRIQSYLIPEDVEYVYITREVMCLHRAIINGVARLFEKENWNLIAIDLLTYTF